MALRRTILLILTPLFAAILLSSCSGSSGEEGFFSAARDSAEAVILLKHEKKLAEQNMWLRFIAFIIVFLVIFLAAVMLGYRRRWLSQQQKISALQQQKEIERLHATIQGEEKERKRIARELHDGIGGRLNAARMHVGALTREFPQLRQSAAFNDIELLLAETTEEIRLSAGHLMPDILLQKGLSKAITQYCATVKRPETLDIDLQLYGAIDEIHYKMQLNIYRIIQELINNIVRHARATKAIVQVIRKESDINITVEDNGAGFNKSLVEEGYGLNNVKFRVKESGGTMQIESEPGGTTVFVEFIIPQKQ